MVASESAARVLLIAPQPFYEDRGTPIAVVQVIRALVELGHEVDLVTYPVGETVEIPGLRYLRGPNPLGFRHVRIGFSLRKVVLDLALVPLVRRRLREPYAFVHAVEEGAFLAALLRGPRRTPLVYDMQSRLSEQLRAVPWLRPLLWLVRRAETWLFRRADVIVASAGLADGVRERAPDARVRTWRFSSPIVDVPPVRVAAVRRELDIPDDARVIAYSGSFAPYQGIAELLAAARGVVRRRPDAVFVLIGAPQPTRAAIAREAARAGVDGNLRLVQRLPRVAVGPFLAMADVLVLPPRHGSNLPLKAFDFLAAGRAIVAADSPSHRTVLSEEVAALVPPGPEAMAGEIVRLLEDEERRRRLAAAAREYAREHLGWMGFVGVVSEIVQLADGRVAERAPADGTGA